MGNACDGAQVLAAAYLTLKNRRLTTNIWAQWGEVPSWIRVLNAHLHSIWYPIMALLICWWFRFDSVMPFVVAYLTHTIIDVFTHDEIASLEPFSGYVFRVGKTFHSWENMKNGTWVVVLGMMIVSATLAIITHIGM